MKARLIEMKTMEESIPKVLSKEEQTWNFAYYCDEYQNRILDMKWHSNVPGSNADEHVILGAIQAKENMGYDVKEAESYIDSGLEAFKNKDYAKLNEITAKIFISLENAPINKASPYWNYKIYENFEEFSKDVKFKKYPYDLNSNKYYEATHKGWIAQICGGALGTAIEGYKTSNIRKIFGEINSYVREVNTFNDDITFEIALLSAIKKKGKEVTSLDIGYEWVSLIPSAWTAEEFALRNLKIGIKPPLSGKLYNPYREWIGAQMRGAMPGMICPGDPYKAAKLAFTDGEVSHYNTGILGEVFNSIMVSLAYVKDDVREIIDEAISYMPKDSLYYSVIKKTYEECKKGNSWEEVWGLCEKEYSIYNWIHALPNASAEVIALYFGNNDFNKTAHIVAMEGYDVDCNAAQILTILGIMNKHIDTKWTSFLNDDLETYMRNLKHISVKELASETVKASIKFNK